MSNGNQEKKGGEKSNDTATVATTETDKAQMALMILRNLYKRALELKKRVWKLDFYTACLCILGIIVGIVIIVLKIHFKELDDIIGISVSSVSSFVSASGAITAFYSFLSSSTSISDSDLEKGIKGSEFESLAKPAALIVKSPELIKEVYDNIIEIREKNNQTAKMEAAQCLYAFLGCIALFCIAGYDLYNFVINQPNGIYVDVALIGLGVIGLYYCLCVGLALQYAKENLKSFYCCLFLCVCGVCLLDENRDLKRICLTRIEEEKILYHLYVKNNNTVSEQSFS
ncbi:26228_t:CDS:2 [Dentiscutata erythropus]|uniref:26228_t:CDS:1 n=1 Tax=Dentiscutata erythropus TaxID=1348616 RepID=A0A9N9HZQ3_9GLOM|nr:26228_t:CDS:2 [Dentiscutata erythropus]